MLDNIIYAINKECSIQEIKNEIDALSDINYKDSNNLSLIHWLVKLQNIPLTTLEEIIDYLLLKNMNIDIPNRKGETALNHACQFNRDDMAILLVKKGASINTCDESNDSPLLWSSYNRNLYMTQFLVENGANIYHQYTDKRNALMWASKRGASDIVRYLLQVTMDINKVDKFGNTAYDLSSNEETDIVFSEWLLENKISMLSYFKNMITNPLYERQLIKNIFSYYTKPFVKKERSSMEHENPTEINTLYIEEI